MNMIRQVTPEDAEALTAFLQRLYSQPCPTIRRWQVLPGVDDERIWIDGRSGERGISFAAIDQNQVVGLVDAMIPDCFEFCHTCTIGLSVLHDYRRRGVGRKLMEAIISWAKTVDLEIMQLEVYDTNSPAINLYESMGFVQEGRRDNAVRLGETTRCGMVYMALPLTNTPPTSQQDAPGDAFGAPEL
jgi:ribosomal protein S18 acetylase RimI-like enzyme